MNLVKIAAAWCRELVWLSIPEVFLSVPAKEITVDIIVPKLMYAAHHCVVANAAINISIYVLNLKFNMLTSYTIILA